MGKIILFILGLVIGGVFGIIVGMVISDEWWRKHAHTIFPLFDMEVKKNDKGRKK